MKTPRWSGHWCWPTWRCCWNYSAIENRLWLDRVRRAAKRSNAWIIWTKNRRLTPLIRSWSLWRRFACCCRPWMFRRAHGGWFEKGVEYGFVLLKSENVTTNSLGGLDGGPWNSKRNKEMRNFGKNERKNEAEICKKSYLSQHSSQELCRRAWTAPQWCSASSQGISPLGLSTAPPHSWAAIPHRWSWKWHHSR